MSGAVAGTKSVKWSLFQSTIFTTVQSTDDNYIIDAVAGSGKTTTVLELIRQMTAVDPELRVLLGAFSKKIQLELTGKITAMELNCQVTVKTIHALGFNIISYFNGKEVKTELANKAGDTKVQRIIDTLIERRKDLLPFTKLIEKAVSMAKKLGIGVNGVCCIDDTKAWEDMIYNYGFDSYLDEDTETRLDKAIAASIWVLKESNKDTKVIDFDDMCYLPLIYNMRFPRWCKFGLVVIDECQDLNITRMLMAEKSISAGGRIVAVGDPFQAIFAFTGAMSDSMEQIAKRFRCKTLPLSVNYRCGKTIVEEAKKYVAHIVAHDDAIEGEVRTIGADEFDKAVLNINDAILCRNNAPLVPIAFKLIRKGVACRIEGREIGTGLIALTKKWKSVKTLDALKDRIETWCVREVGKASDKKNEKRMEYINDQAATIQALIDAAKVKGLDLNGMRIMISEMFGDSFDSNGKPAKPMVVLSSYHKSKGLEWRKVYLLDHGALCPSKYAVREWEVQAEANVAYVAITRAMEGLYYVDTTTNTLNKPEEKKAA